MILDRNAHYTASGRAVACNLGNGKALLNLESNLYFTLNSVGAFVWDQLQRRQTPATLKAAMLAAYAVDEVRCETDIANLLAALIEAGLVECCDAVPA